MSEAHVASKIGESLGYGSARPLVLDLSRNLLLPCLDALCILLLPICQTGIGTEFQQPGRFLAFWALLAFITILLTSSYGGYHGWQARRGVCAKLAVRSFTCTAIVMLTVAILLGHDHAVSRHWTTAELMFTPVALVFIRTVAADSLVGASTADGPLVVCFNHCPSDLIKALIEQNLAPRAAGVLYLSQQASLSHPAAWPVLPDPETLLGILKNRHVRDLVLVHEPGFEESAEAWRKLPLSDLLAYPVRIWLAVSLAPEWRGPLLGGLNRCRLMPVANDRLVNSRNPAKRGFDIAVGILLLALAMPLLGLLAVLVRCSGPGPIVFRQPRTGAHGRGFELLKFRTMTHRAGAPFTQAGPGDKRVTPIGRFLRRTSLDELLQLVNVVRGDMSLVGPRPHAPETQVEGIDFEQAVQFYRLRHRVKPGMTGLAQIRGFRGETRQLGTLEQRIASDLEYIDRWSLWLDVLIILRTLPTVLGQRNAY